MSTISTISRFVSASVFVGLFLLESGPLAATTYYVSTSGNNANTGTSTAAAWRTITYAGTKAAAGDTVYIKAGLYQETAGATITKSGTAASPIIFEGYKNTPGDRPTYPSYTPGDTLNSTEIPVIRGNNAYNLIGIECSHDYVTIRNLGVDRFDIGARSYGGDYVTLRDVFATNSDGTPYSTGTGIWFYNCHHGLIANCTATDSAMHNFMLQGTHDTVMENCKSYAPAYSPSLAASDYHIVVRDSYNDTVNNCLARNLHTDYMYVHPGHGIGIKDTDGAAHSYGNVISNCIAYDMGECFYVAHSPYNNTFTNCKAYGHWVEQSAQNSWNQGIDIRDGAHDNTFSRCRVEGIRTGIVIQWTGEASSSPQICSNNTIANCVIADANVGIRFSYANNNTLKNIVFNNASQWCLLYYPDSSANTGNTIRNSIVSNCSGSFKVGSGNTPRFTYTDFWANAFSMFVDTGNIAVDPRYADVANKDFHLKSTGGRWNPATSSWVIDTVTSPCIDTGNPADAYSLEPAINGGRINMGAYGNTAEASKAKRTVTRPPTRTPYVPSRR